MCSVFPYGIEEDKTMVRLSPGVVKTTCVDREMGDSYLTCGSSAVPLSIVIIEPHVLVLSIFCHTFYVK